MVHHEQDTNFECDRCFQRVHENSLKGCSVLYPFRLWLATLLPLPAQSKPKLLRSPAGSPPAWKKDEPPCRGLTTLLNGFPPPLATAIQ